MDLQKLHGVWTNRWTFVLAATGSAVGLGNIWKFPYITGENGGGAFVLVYLVCIALIGVPIMVAEVLIGRRGRQSPINSMRFLAREAGASQVWSGVGWMGVLAGLLILSFYSVIAGWALNYVVETATGTFTGADGEMVNNVFGGLLADQGKLIQWHTIFILMTISVVAGGVTHGLGIAARILMPLLFVMLLMLFGYGMATGDVAQAASFMFSFKFDALTWQGVLIAMGHAFFTLSLGMGSIMAYGAYMPDHANVGQTVITVGVLDTVIALIAGMVIFPIVFANGLEAGSGPGLLFVRLPLAFGNMPGGVLFGTLFFLLVVVAAWTSAVSLIEPGVAWLIETKKFNRVTANLLLGFVSWSLGITAILSFNSWESFTPWYLLNKNPFGFLDFLTSQVMLPLGGLFIAIFVGWCVKREVIEKEMDAEGHPVLEIWYWVVRIISPLLVALVFITTLWATFAGS